MNTSLNIDRLIDLMDQKGASQLVMSSDEPPRVLSYGQWIVAGITPTSSSQMSTLLQAIAPAHLQNELGKTSSTLEWEHFAISGKYKIQAHTVFGTRTLTITQEVAARSSTPATPHVRKKVSSATMRGDAPSVLPLSAPHVPGPPQLPGHAGSIPSTPPPLPPSIARTPPPVGHRSSPVDERRELASVGRVLLITAVVVTVLVALVGAQEKYKRRDQSAYLAGEVVEKFNTQKSGAELNVVRLHRDEAMHYSGRGEYSDGDVADVSVDVTRQNFLGTATEISWRVEPHSFADMLSGEITEDANKTYASRGSSLRVMSLSLARNSRTSYSGTASLNGKRRGTIAVEIKTFDSDGSPATWNYSLQPEPEYDNDYPSYHSPSYSTPDYSSPNDYDSDDTTDESSSDEDSSDTDY